VITIADVTKNPVLRRELAERAASKRAAVAVTLWLLLLSGLAILVYFAYTASSSGLDPVGTDSARIGKDLFEWALFGMLGLVLFLVPAFTASAVAGERTRQTLIPVQITSLSPFAIVLGKSLAAIAFTVLLVISAAPILAVAFLIGGVGLGDIAKGLAMIVLSAIMLGSVGIMISSLFKKVQAAIVVSYGFVLAIAVGTFVVLGSVAVAQAAASDDFNEQPSPPKEILAANPFAGLADVTASSDVTFGSNPLTGIRSLINAIETEPFNNGRFGEVPDETTAVWRWYVLFCVLTTYWSLYVATNRLRTPAETER
jgi:ABC-type transport system involved in multi-copper enzyme maturation permease subunit